MRQRVLGAAMVLALGLPTGCRASTDLRDQVRSLITGAERSSLQYVYQVIAEDHRFEVRGQVEDTLRHSETLLIDGQEVLQRVMSDDALAIHVSSPGALPQLSTPQPAGSEVVTSLLGGRWVLDTTGAPSEDSETGDLPLLGSDPLKDARTIFQYLRTALDGTTDVYEFNPDDPSYRPEFDPFPAPKAGGEKRVDLARPPIPRTEASLLVGSDHFRKMSLYLSGDKLARILEVIDVDGHEDVRRARQTGRNKDLLALVNEIKAGKTAQKINERKMSFEIISEEASGAVVVPADAVRGNLRFLFSGGSQSHVSP